jgi:[ribosomal protein S5]-alanine N-acetyltransferase
LSRGGLEIETDRLKLRPLAPEDLDSIQRIWNDPEVRRYLWDGKKVSREVAADVISRSAACFEGRRFGLWAVIDEQRDELIGFCGFWRFDGRPDFELAYGLAPARWGEGLATEAARAAIRHGFEEADLDRIAASADTPNTALLRVMRKAGMRHEKREICEGRDTTCYAISREDFRARAVPSAAPG